MTEKYEKNAREQAGLVIEGAAIVTMENKKRPESGPFIGDIRIANGRIDAIRAGDSGTPGLAQPGDEILDARGCVAMPGLVNAHQHTPMALLRGFADELKLMDWLESNTAGSAELLGLGAEIGMLTVGRKADLILVDMRRPHLQPVHDFYSLLAYAANGSDVETVIVDGRFLMRDRQLLTIDEEATLREAAAAARRITAGI